VRATEIDKIEIYKCFRPGDIIKAEVISLGDSRSYILSTAKNEYGVMYATSVAGKYFFFHPKIYFSRPPHIKINFVASSSILTWMGLSVIKKAVVY
jgi:hypothetical protein